MKKGTAAVGLGMTPKEGHSREAGQAPDTRLGTVMSLLSCLCLRPSKQLGFCFFFLLAQFFLFFPSLFFVSFSLSLFLFFCLSSLLSFFFF